MANPTELPPTSGPASPSAYATAVNAWLSALKASWADSANPAGMIDGLVQYFTAAGAAPRLRFRRAGAWAGILDDVGRETGNLNTALEGGLRHFGGGAGNAPFTQAGTALVIPRGAGITQVAFRQADADHAYIRSSLDGSGSSWTTWRRLFTQADIVGTVSRSSGIQTGAVIESGELSSGHYTRYADGTQVCHATRTLTRDDTSRLHNLWNFPRDFISNDYAVAMTLRSLSAAPVRSMLSSTSVGNTVSTTQLRILQYRSNGMTDFAGGDTANMDVTVHGRWAAPA